MQAGRLWHVGHPILAWMAGHCAVRRDDKDNIMPSKCHSTARIDGIVAAIIGLSRAMFQEPVRRSANETRGRLSWNGKKLADVKQPHACRDPRHGGACQRQCYMGGFQGSVEDGVPVGALFP